MRPLGLTDLTVTARALIAAPLGQRWILARRLVQQADAADRYRKRFGKAHPDWGNGTLMSAAFHHELRDEPWLSDHDFQDCVIMVIDAVRARSVPRIS